MSFTPESLTKGVVKYQATGSGAIAETLSVGTHYKLLRVELHLDNVGGGDFTLGKDDIGGAAYDVNYITVDMTAEEDIYEPFEHPPIFGKDDLLIAAYTNAAARTWGLTIVVELQ